MVYCFDSHAHIHSEKLASLLRWSHWSTDDVTRRSISRFDMCEESGESLSHEKGNGMILAQTVVGGPLSDSGN